MDEKIKTSFYIDKKLLDKIDELKAKDDRSRNWIVTKALEEYLKDK